MMTLEEMKAVDIRTVDPETLVDIRDVHIDRTLPKEERIKSFIRQIKNPYVYKCGDIIVKATFSDTDGNIGSGRTKIVTEDERSCYRRLFRQERSSRKELPI